MRFFLSEYRSRLAAWASGLLSACLLLGIVVVAGTWTIHPDPMSRLLAVKVPQGIEARSTALLIAGAQGWTPEHEQRAQRLSELHTLVIGVDGAGLVADFAGDCDLVAEPLSQIARLIQQREGALARLPVLASLGDGADLSLRVSTAGPSGFKGLVTDGIGTAPMLCSGALIPKTLGSKAPIRWLDVVQPGTSSPASSIAGTKIVEATAGPRKAFYRSYLGIAGTDSAFDLQTSTQSADLQDLPLTIHKDATAPQTDTYAIFLSGDGGWAKFDEEVSDRLAANGIPVVGISSLRYLWQEKTPQQIARDFARIDRHYRDAFNRSKVLLVGFSLGANTLPFVTAQLPGELQNRLAGLGLIAPETRTGFEIVIGGWLGQQTGAIEVVPGIDALAAHLPAHRIACLHGDDESVSACPEVTLAGIRSTAFRGGHHLGHDHPGIVNALLDLIRPDT